tara:strand:- start:963 stop:1442 length:480 start_codon:yes stop_codon:yes gene_type:complete
MSKNCWDVGQRAEDLFAACLAKRGISCRPSNRDEQIYGHIDFHTDKGTVDVKAMKRVNRSDSSQQNQYTWVEFKNVRGNVGWLCSKVDFIAFEYPDYFLVVKRSSLEQKAKLICDLDNLTNKGGMEALYRGYQRAGRKDLIAMIKMSDIESLPHKKLPK